ncbi:MAG: hypothetical protein COX52_08835 [Syntrophobacterales bacterium CG23_combo_of_CG06-09_8_20_14_all_48_27]|nr:MAG: hypothetical protein COX52_08835 [Syntrophobacterales bacterium CG23_combo_of_CG06-09_8_20_14_all_48_27]
MSHEGYERCLLRPYQGGGRSGPLSQVNGSVLDAADYADAGANAILEGALLISCTKELIREMLRRNIDINVVAPRISPNISAGRDFFEDIAKIRAIRRIWARMMKEEFGAGPKGMAMRFYARGIGSYMEGRQPLVNIVRGTLTTLIGVLSGASGIQTCSYDEAWCPPTEEAAKLALRTQQVIRYESGIPRVADPLGGSYYVEWLTNRIEEEILATVDRIEQMGGWLAAIEKDWIRSQLRQGAIERQRKVESGERVRVGVNCFAEEEETEIRVPDIRDEVTKYISRYKRFKERRDMQKVKKALEDLSRAAEIEGVDLVPCTFEAVKAHATFAEIVGVLRMKDGLDYDLLGERSYPFS